LFGCHWLITDQLVLKTNGCTASGTERVEPSATQEEQGRYDKQEPLQFARYA
jgi:hypothetical protein